MDFRFIKFFLLSFIVLLSITAIKSQERGINSDQWAATDALGRKVADYSTAGQKRKDK
jgi:hypothetical protein